MATGIHSLIPEAVEAPVGEAVSPGPLEREPSPADAGSKSEPSIDLNAAELSPPPDSLIVGTHEYLPIHSIRPNVFQPRTAFDEEAINGLADSIRALGVLQPILVRRDGDGFELIAGERRWRAAQIAGLVEVPAIIRDVADERSLEEALVENVQRQDLNPIDEAFAYQQLMEDFRLSQTQVATRVGKNRATIANAIRLLRLPGSIRQLVAGGELSAGHGRALLMIDNAEEQASMAGQCASEGWSVRHIEAVARELGSDATGPAGSKPKGSARRGSDSKSKRGRSAGGKISSTAALEVETQLSDALHTTVEVVESKSRHQLVIDFADADDLSRIVSIIAAGG